MEFIKEKYNTIYDKKNSFICYYIEKKKLYVYAKYHQYLSTFFISIEDLVAITTKGHLEQVFFILKDMNESLSIVTPSVSYSRDIINAITEDIQELKNKTVNNKMIKEV
mgnify:FL=1